MAIINHPSYARIVTLTQSFVDSVSAKQADFFIANGRYFQGINLVDGQPDGETDINMDATKKPTDQLESWSDFDSKVFKNNIKIPFNVKVNIYESPAGWGWELIIEVWKADLGPDAYGNDGDHWIYRHHEGPAPKGGIFDTWYIDPDPTDE